MGGKEDELLISPELLRTLFTPLQEVLKENGEAVIELSDQVKILVTLVTSSPTRKDIKDALENHEKQTREIERCIDKLRQQIKMFLWITGIIWTALAAADTFMRLVK